ncbi:MAG: hypothetical protein R2777_04385 [Chitinophagales bacterium]
MSKLLLIPSCMVYNNGGNTATGISVETNIYSNSTSALVYNTTMTQASLATFITTLTASSAFTPPAVDFYLAEFIVSINEADADITNDTLYWGINVTDSLYRERCCSFWLSKWCYCRIRRRCWKYFYSW